MPSRVLSNTPFSSASSRRTNHTNFSVTNTTSAGATVNEPSTVMSISTASPHSLPSSPLQQQQKQTNHHPTANVLQNNRSSRIRLMNMLACNSTGNNTFSTRQAPPATATTRRGRAIFVATSSTKKNQLSSSSSSTTLSSPASDGQSNAAAAWSVGWVAQLTQALASCMKTLSSPTVQLSARRDSAAALVASLKDARGAVEKSTLANHSDVVVSLEHIVPLITFQILCVGIVAVNSQGNGNAQQQQQRQQQQTQQLSTSRATTMNSSYTRNNPYLSKSNNNNNNNTNNNSNNNNCNNSHGAPTASNSFTFNSSSPSSSSFTSSSTLDGSAFFNNNDNNNNFVNSAAPIPSLTMRERQQRDEFLLLCCTSLKLITEMLGPLLSLKTSCDIATTLVDVLLLLLFGVPSSSSTGAPEQSRLLFLFGAGADLEALLDLFLRPVAAWESTAMDCLASVARNLETPVVLLPHILAHFLRAVDCLMMMMMLGSTPSSRESGGSGGAQGRRASCASPSCCYWTLDKRFQFVAELILTLLEDGASKNGIERAYAIFPSTQLRTANPFVIPAGLQLDDKMVKSMKEFFATGCGQRCASLDEVVVATLNQLAGGSDGGGVGGEAAASQVVMNNSSNNRVSSNHTHFPLQRRQLLHTTQGEHLRQYHQEAIVFANGDDTQQATRDERSVSASSSQVSMESDTTLGEQDQVDHRHRHRHEQEAHDDDAQHQNRNFNESSSAPSSSRQHSVTVIPPSTDRQTSLFGNNNNNNNNNYNNNDNTITTNSEPAPHGHESPPLHVLDTLHWYSLDARHFRHHHHHHHHHHQGRNNNNNSNFDSNNSHHHLYSNHGNTFLSSCASSPSSSTSASIYYRRSPSLQNHYYSRHPSTVQVTSPMSAHPAHDQQYFQTSDGLTLLWQFFLYLTSTSTATTTPSSSSSSINNNTFAAATTSTIKTDTTTNSPALFDLQVRTLALLYTFYPHDVGGVLLRDHWEGTNIYENHNNNNNNNNNSVNTCTRAQPVVVDISTKRRIINQLCRSPPFAMLISHPSLMSQSAWEKYEKTKTGITTGKNEIDDDDDEDEDNDEQAEEQKFAVVIGSLALVPLE